jgi:hypothetical protein
VAVEQRASAKQPWFKSTWFIILMIVLIAPIGAVMAWVMRPRWPLWLRVLIALWGLGFVVSAFSRPSTPSQTASQAAATAGPAASTPTTAPPTATPNVEATAQAQAAADADAHQAAQAAFMDGYGKQLYQLMLRSDKPHQALVQGSGQASSIGAVGLFQLAKASEDQQAAIQADISKVQVPAEARKLKDSVFFAVGERKRVAQKLQQALDNAKTSNLAALQQQVKDADGAVVQSAAQFAIRAEELGVDFEAFTKNAQL